MAIPDDLAARQEVRNASGIIAIRGNLLARNAALNFAGQVVPLFIALVAVPITIRHLGVERFGVLSLAWVLLGYFGIFDLGLGRATIKFVAQALGEGESSRVPPILWTSLALQGLLGAAGALVLIAVTPFLTVRLIRMPQALASESAASFYLLSLAIPIVMSSGSLKGVLEAHQRFGLVNSVRVVSNSLLFSLPAVGAVVGFHLPGIIALLVGSMTGTALAYLILCMRTFPSLRASLQVDRALIGSLFRFGGWVTVGSTIVPFLIYSDRLLIGSLVSVAALGYYTAPYELASRLQVFPWSFATTLFPAFSTAAARGDVLVRLYARGLKYLLLVMGPVTLAIIVLAGVILRAWLGVEFAARGTLVFQILALGMLLNSLSQIPANLLDGIGRPDLRAKIFLSYVFLYVGLAWLLISRLGIAGAALAWAIRSGVELSLFFAFSWRLLSLKAVTLVESGLVRTVIAFLTLAAAAGLMGVLLYQHILVHAMVVTMTFGLFAVTCWRYVLDQSDRDVIRSLIPQFAGRG